MASFKYPKPARTSASRARFWGFCWAGSAILAQAALGFVGAFEVMEVFADVFMILGIRRCQCSRLAIEARARRRTIQPGAAGRRPAPS